MTASELKYIITASELNTCGNGAKMAAMAQRLHVSKVSVCRAVERLIASGYLCQNGKKILLTEKGTAEIADYLVLINFIGNKLQQYCGVSGETAFDDALGAACALGDESRGKVLAFVKNQTVNK